MKKLNKNSSIKPVKFKDRFEKADFSLLAAHSKMREFAFNSRVNASKQMLALKAAAAFLAAFVVAEKLGLSTSSIISEAGAITTSAAGLYYGVKSSIDRKGNEALQQILLKEKAPEDVRIQKAKEFLAKPRI